MKTITPILLSVLIMGCSSNQGLEPMELTFNNVDVTNDAVIRALDSLSESAAIAAEANRIVASLENGKAMIKMDEKEYIEYIKNRDYVPQGMEVEFDANYEGPIIPILRTAAAVSGYELAYPASRPIVEPTVDINTLTNSITGKRNSNITNVFDAINAINTANSDRIDIKIHEKIRIIELIYK